MSATIDDLATLGEIEGALKGNGVGDEGKQFIWFAPTLTNRISLVGDSSSEPDSEIRERL
jgi:hypothetical protein